jgi:hypothetical protein
MHPRRIGLCTLAALTCALVGRTGAETPVSDPDLPQPLDLNAAAPLISKPPFTRPLNLSEKLQLTGIAYVQGKPVATLVDRETKQNYLVSEEPNAQGWKLAGATASTALKSASVQLQVGSETVTIHYGDAQLTPTSGARRSSGPSVWPSDQDVLRTGEDGKLYVRSSAYLSDADRERYYRGWSRDSHEKYRGILMEQRETMLKASPQQRADIAKKVFDQVDAEERARGGSGGDSGRPSFGGPYRGGGPGGDSGRPSFGNPPFRGGDSNNSGGGPR